MPWTKIITITAISVSLVAGVMVGTAISHDKLPNPATPFAELIKTWPTHTVTPTATPAALPAQLNIPKLGIQAAVEMVGLDDKRRMDVPKNPHNVAWYTYGAVPGQVGNAVIAGHLDSTIGPAVFYKLDTLQLGDQLTVTNQVGHVSTFKVVQKAVYRYDEFPLQHVFGPTDKTRLNLITCEGTFNRQAKNYSHRTVIYTELVS